MQPKAEYIINWSTMALFPTTDNETEQFQTVVYEFFQTFTVLQTPEEILENSKNYYHDNKDLTAKRIYDEFNIRSVRYYPVAMNFYQIFFKVTKVDDLNSSIYFSARYVDKIIKNKKTTVVFLNKQSKTISTSAVTIKKRRFHCYAIIGLNEALKSRREVYDRSCL